MAVTMPREKWTDERLDELKKNARFDAANRNLIAFAVAIIAAVIGSNAF